MRAHTDNIRFLSILGDYVSRDTGSIEGWSCLILRGLLGDSNTDTRFDRVYEHLHTLEGSMVAGVNGDLILIYRGQGAAGQLKLTKLIMEILEVEEMPHTSAYDLSTQRDAAATEFAHQVSQLKAQQLEEPDIDYDLTQNEGIACMAKVLDNSKFLRRHRSPLTVLLVEDDPVTCRLAGNLIRKEYVLVTASSAYEAIVNYLVYAPDIVFLDINLPDESGLSVLQQITACDADAYVVMFSGNDAIDNLIDARQHGAMGFIAKPFQRDRLRHYLSDCATLKEISTRGLPH